MGRLPMNDNNPQNPNPQANWNQGGATIPTDPMTTLPAQQPNQIPTATLTPDPITGITPGQQPSQAQNPGVSPTPETVQPVTTPAPEISAQTPATNQTPTPTFVPPGVSASVTQPTDLTALGVVPQATSEQPSELAPNEQITDQTSANIPPPQAISAADSAPTDLSQLTATVENSSTIVQPVFASQVTNTDPNAQAQSPTISAEPPKSETTNSKLPFILIGVGIFAVIIATAASAYFILGIGQPTPPTVSVPAESSPTQLTTPPKASSAPSTIPVPVAAPIATQSATPAATLKPTPTPKSGSSAADLLKQRQSSPSTSSPSGASSPFLAQ